MSRKDASTYETTTGVIYKKTCITMPQDVYSQIQNISTAYGWTITITLNMLIGYALKHMDKFEEEITDLVLKAPRTPSTGRLPKRTLLLVEEYREELKEYAKKHNQKNTTAYTRACIFGLAHLEDVIKEIK